MNQKEHKQRHVQLHKKFDELLADFIGHTGRLPSQTSLIDFLNWSYQQTISPSELPNSLDEDFHYRSRTDECICGYNPETGYRTDILCPVHDEPKKPQ